ncbi:hypothetical protein RV02_GL003189 [Enterococcus gilvus]|nr:hypothetical protein RV02_GL003189 [Enterococcus gilvus]
MEELEEIKMGLTVFKMEFYHFDNTSITMMKNSKFLYSVEIVDDNGRYEFSNGLTFKEAKAIVDSEIQTFADKLKVN